MGSSNTTTYNADSQTHWERNATGLGGGVTVKISGSTVATSSETSTTFTSLVVGNTTYTRIGNVVSSPSTGITRYSFTTTVGSSSQEDVIQSSTETIATYKLYVRTA